MATEALKFEFPVIDSYLYESAYFDYINDKITNEEAIASHLSKYIPVNEAAYAKVRAINEAKMTDKIKVAWQRFVNFIKGIFSKFMESCTNILFNEKNYLVKYKDIILNKKPKDIDFSYVGDFETGIQRCIDTKLPVFDWNTHHAACEAEGYGELVKLLTNGKMTYDSGNDNLAEQFKTYFFASEDGKTTNGKFADLNFKNMYNFCYNFDKIDQMVKEDTKHLDQSTNAIMNAIKKELEANPAENPQQPTGESAIFSGLAYDLLREADENGAGTDTGGSGGTPPNKPENNNNSNEKNTNAVSKMGSFQVKPNVTDEDKARNAEDAKASGATSDNVSKVCRKWQDACKAMLTAKCTVVQNIAQTYMKIIRSDTICIRSNCHKLTCNMHVTNVIFDNRSNCTFTRNKNISHLRDNLRFFSPPNKREGIPFNVTCSY